MKLVRPISEDKRRKLEEELELQKKRFNEATQASAKTIQENLSIVNWVQDYPLQCAGLVFLGGFLATQIYLSKKSQLPS